MKGMKGKLLKKIKSIKPVGYLQLQDRILQANPSFGNFDSCPKDSDIQFQTSFDCDDESEKKKKIKQSSKQEPDVTELMRDLEDEEMESDEEFGEDKENIRPVMAKREILKRTEQELRQSRASEASELPSPEPDNRREKPLSEIDISSYRRPELNSCSLFDPNLLAAFHQAVMEYMRLCEAQRINRVETEELEQQDQPSKSPQIDNPLLQFEEKCPPGGSESVILYTTTLRGIRKTFEGCSSIRFLLESFRIVYFERDVSMHREFREELRRILDCRAVPPKLFVRGRYIGGAEEVLMLHEQGKLKPLFNGVPIDSSDGPCEGCGGIRFVVCFNCNGSHKVIDEDGKANMCPNCNENGLIICPLCC
ncbi:hypothetical protein UlMin_025241 [Ulmus minor]